MPLICKNTLNRCVEKEGRETVLVATLELEDGPFWEIAWDCA
jgi:hypothetical protein